MAEPNLLEALREAEELAPGPMTDELRRLRKRVENPAFDVWLELRAAYGMLDDILYYHSNELSRIEKVAHPTVSGSRVHMAEALTAMRERLRSAASKCEEQMTDA